MKSPLESKNQSFIEIVLYVTWFVEAQLKALQTRSICQMLSFLQNNELPVAGF